MGGVNAQNPNTRDVRDVYVDISPIISAVHVDKDFILHNEVRFIFNNFASSNLSVIMDFGDGTTTQVFPNDVLTHFYPINNSNGIVEYELSFILEFPPNLVPSYDFHTLKLKPTFGISTGSATNFAAPDAVWHIQSSATFSPPVSGAFPAGSTYNTNTTSGGDAYIKYAPGHTHLTKPLIFVDGIDFDPTTYTYKGEVIRHGSTGWDVFNLGNDAGAIASSDNAPSVFREYPEALNQFSANGYDIIFLDFVNGVDYIQKNGLVLVELIKRINEEKKLALLEGQENVCDNAVVGASMGGQVAKWALSYMEENGIDHQCHTYVSFDSPQKGAHIPLAIQSFAYLAYVSGNDTDNYWARLNSPAARQMLIQTLGNDWNMITGSSGGVSIGLSNLDGCSGSSTIPIDLVFNSSLELRNSFKSEMAQKGYPLNTRNISVSCGSYLGTKVEGLADGALYFEANRHEDPNNLVCGSVKGDVAHINFGTLNNGTSVGYSSPVEPLTFCSSGGIGCTSFNIPSVTNCLFRGFFPNTFTSIIGNSAPQIQSLLTVRDLGVLPALDNAPGCIRGDLQSIGDQMLALDLDVTTFANYTTFMPTLSLLDVNWPMDDAHLTMELKPNNPDWVRDNTPFDAVYSEVENLRHIELTPAMRDWVIIQMNQGLDEADAVRLDLASGEKYNYGYRKNRLPDTEVASGAVLSINLNGATGLQSAPGTAANLPHFKVFTGGGCSQGKIINVQKDGLVQIGDPNSSKSGELNLLTNSIMTVKSGATLRISKTSALIVQEGARLIIEQGAKIILSDPNSELRIEEGATLELLGQPDFSGEGYWHFAGDNEPIFGPDMSTWRLEGIAKGRRMLKVEGQLKIPALKNIELRKGLVEYNSGRISVHTLGYAAGLVCDFVGDEKSTAIDAYYSNNMQFIRCDFEGFGTGIEAYITPELHLTACTFKNNGIGLHHTQWSGRAVLSGCTFDASPVLFDDTKIINISNSKFKNDEAGRHGGALSLSNNAICAIWGSEFSNNDTGIGAGVSGKGASNVDIFKSTFENNTIGINSLGSGGVGLVKAACSVFRNNLLSILGTDILLRVAGGLGTPDGQSPNLFIKGDPKNQYINVCYDNITPEPMDGNLTNNDWGGDLNPLKSIIVGEQSSCDMSIAQVDPIAVLGPGMCGIEEPQTPKDIEEWVDDHHDDDCQIDLTGTDINIRTDFFEGEYGLYYHYNPLIGIDLLVKVASQYTTTHYYTYSVDCRYHISAAYAIVKAMGEEGNIGRLQQGTAVIADMSKETVLFPNPSGSYTNVVLSEVVPSDVLVYDCFGKAVFKSLSVQGTLQIDLQDFPSGLYSVEIREEGKRAVREKLMVQRL